MNDFIGTYYIDTDLCYALSQLMLKNPHRQPTAFERGYTLVSSEDMSKVWMSLYELEIYRCISQYAEEFRYCAQGCAGMEMEHPYNVQHYEPGHYYSVWHCENNGKKPFQHRHLAFMTYLNTVDGGGETEFLYQKRSVTPVIGKTLVWPAYFTHTHRGMPAHSDKFIITGWFRFFNTEKFQQQTDDLTDEEFYSQLERLDRVL